MKLSENIKKLRREREITQEDLAEMLGISAQAVSHWECGRTMPDVTQLPVLANVFEVTTDELLGVDVASKAKRIEEIRKQAQSVNRQEALGIFRQGVEEYPDSHQLLCDYAWELYWNTGDDELKRKTGKIIAGYIDRILRTCTDTKVRNLTTDLACRVYPLIGRREDALALAESMDSAVTKLDLLPLILEGREKMDALREQYMVHLTCGLDIAAYYFKQKDGNGSYYFPEDERMQALEKILGIYRLLYEDGDYLFEAQSVQSVCASAAWHCVTHGAYEKAVGYAVKSAECAVQFDHTSSEQVHTSLMPRGKHSEEAWRNGAHNNCHELLAYYRGDEDFYPVREDERFVNMLKLLEDNAE